MLHVNNEKQETIRHGKNRTTKSRKKKNARRKGNVRIFEYIGSLYHQTSGGKSKKLKIVSQENVKATVNQTI